MLQRNASLRAQISVAQKDFFEREMVRAEGHVAIALHGALRAARHARLAASFARAGTVDE